MQNVYESVVDEIQQAGFFASPVESMGHWDRVTVCSKRRPQGGYTGNSFWITKLSSGWYLGTWGGERYRVPDNDRLGCLCVEWLRRKSEQIGTELDQDLRAQYGLVGLSCEEFDHLLNSC